MRVLYCALDQVVPGTTGGSTHVRAVAEGLARLGHEVHVLAAEGPRGFPATSSHAGPRWHALSSPGGRPHLRLLQSRAVARLAGEVRPEVVIERYHNFGGEGILAARRVGARAVLEVNAPIVDHPGSAKRALDRALVLEPMRRWRERVCRLTDVFVTPSSRILPAWVPPDRIAQVEWGADTERFRPDAAGPVPYDRHEGECVAVFAGAFRSWHGAAGLARAAAAIEKDGVSGVHAVFIGDGPEMGRTREAAAALRRATFTGALSHDRMPAALAAADVGVAPFDASSHAPLQLDFYWSPLKIFEYMASGLPVVAPAIPRLARLVEDRREGVLYDPGGGDAALAEALRCCLDPDRRRAMGRAARARVVRDFGWDVHCRKLEDALRRAIDRGPGRRPPDR
jgi:glycosyltransferase involved in cell wall biosynthesis